MASENEVLGQEEQRLKQLMDEADKAIHQMESELAELPLDKGPALEFRPPNMPAKPSVGANSKRRLELTDAIEKEKNQVLEEADKLVAKLPQHVRNTSRDMLNEWLQPDVKKNKDLAKEKDLNNSQDFAFNLRYNKRINPDLARQKTIDQSQDFALNLRNKFPYIKERSDIKTLDQSQEFTFALRNVKSKKEPALKEKSEEVKSITDASKAIEKGDRLEPKNTITFFQELKLNHLDEIGITGIDADLEKDSREGDNEPDMDK